ncbi:MAG: hypothetical protein QNK37_01305 [Acidobacteriota bacterium]|nr:hypothetical protein [Acidobacteriota bacterium]
MKKYLVIIAVFAGSFALDISPVIQGVDSLGQHGTAYADETIKIYGRPPLATRAVNQGESRCESGIGFCIGSYD